jgi:large subunit ribosomal protein L30
MTFAVVRVRGSVNVKSDILDTLKMLRLHRVNHCVIIPESETYLGMLRKVKDYVTWGEIKPEVLAKMIIHRGKLEGDKKVTDKFIKSNSHFKSIMSFSKAVTAGEARYQDINGIKPVIRLHPPKKGYEGVKRSFQVGGALGYRGSEINALIDRMI